LLCLLFINAKLPKNVKPVNIYIKNGCGFFSSIKRDVESDTLVGCSISFSVVNDTIGKDCEDCEDGESGEGGGPPQSGLFVAGISGDDFGSDGSLKYTDNFSAIL
jgi:hypothetical protein